ncbi:CDPK-related kinase 3 isoform X2 [Brachypodium distachyon]|uniref:CDPK-related kinase 3 isoform X2 n=1 Tax=Brachypodium distachyon TaxID=15368 RepID=UPI00071C6458|nr:CDPK-related kinase 3 isoform X2 [Brachypodium distachyon]|eukprot:XP_014755644.1 CDPK-related kinase 3 isoform X2 [Brachypodium distachyon]
MGQCYAKNVHVDGDGGEGGGGVGSGVTTTISVSAAAAGHEAAAVVGESAGGGGRRSSRPSPAGTPRRGRSGATPARTSVAGSPWAASPLPEGIAPSPATSASTPRRFFRRPFPPPSPAKHIKASLARRLGHRSPASSAAQSQAQAARPQVAIPEHAGGSGGGGEVERELDKSFGYDRHFAAKYELGKEVGRGHFGHTCLARARKGDMKGQVLAVKVISKAKMTTAISIEDVRREVKILKALSGHSNLVKFYDACEDALNVYIIMELCEGGELLDRILSRGGRYTEVDAKVIIGQILSVVAFCHLQGVVHRDLKPENFLFSTREEHSPMKIIDFGLSDFIRPGSAYYVAPEVLHRSYSTEADMWSIGVIIYILLCGSRPFWARTESGIFRSVLRADPNFDDSPWASISPEAKDFVKRLLNKDYRKRMTAAQALSHPWLRHECRPIPLDILVFRLVKAYLRSTPFKRAALKALSRAISEDELTYIRAQFNLLEPRDGRICIENFRIALLKNSTEAMTESKVPEILLSLEPLAYRQMDFAEFCTATVSPYQLEASPRWEEIANTAFECFEQEGNRVITIEELALEMNLTCSAFSIVRDWIRPSDGKLSFVGYTKFLHGLTMRSSNARRQQQ